MGNGMNKILPGLYVGNYRDSRDTVQLSKNNITHILSIHDNAKPLHIDKRYLCIEASDTATQDLSQYFTECIDFIHSARLSGGGVLVHCLAGISRSVTVTVAYIMAVTDLGWREALNAVRGSRTCASPNFGFQRQLHEFQFGEGVTAARLIIKTKYPECPFNDREECQRLLEANRQWVQTGSLPATSDSSTSEVTESGATNGSDNSAKGSDRFSKVSPEDRAELWAERINRLTLAAAEDASTSNRDVGDETNGVDNNQVKVCNGSDMDLEKRRDDAFEKVQLSERQSLVLSVNHVSNGAAGNDVDKVVETPCVPKVGKIENSQNGNPNSETASPTTAGNLD